MHLLIKFFVCSTILFTNLWIFYTIVIPMKSILNLNMILISVAAFHIIAFLISFLHWFLDTYTTQLDQIRKRTFNQAKMHHYNPQIVIAKDFFSRNDDALYGATVMGIATIICSIYFAANDSKVWFLYSLMMSTFVSLEIHRYAHMKIHKIPYIIRGLQKTRLILNPEGHKTHHMTLNQSYDLMSTYMNDFLDFIKIFPTLEWIIEKMFGIKPRTYLNNSAEEMELKDQIKGLNLSTEDNTNDNNTNDDDVFE